MVRQGQPALDHKGEQRGRNGLYYSVSARRGSRESSLYYNFWPVLQLTFSV